jgi:MFS family permease
MASPHSRPNKSARPAGAWLVVGLLWLAGCSNYLTRTMLTTMHGSIMQAIPMSETQFGLLTSVFLWVYACMSPVGGFLADRFSRRRVIICSIFSWSMITWLMAYATTFRELLVLRALLGMSEACYIPAALALITDYHRGPTRSLATGLHMSGLVFGSTIGGLGGWLAENHTWSYAYAVIGLPNIAFSGLLMFLLRDAPRETAVAASTALPSVGFGSALRSLFRSLPYYYVILAWCLQGAVGWLIIGWMPTFMHEQFGLRQGAAGFSALGYVYVTQMFGLLAGGLWSDRWSLTNPRARILIPVIGLAAAAPAFWLAGHTPVLAFTILSLVLWGLAEGFLGANMTPIICLVTDARYRATGLGVLNGFTAVFGGLAVYGVGALRDLQIDTTRILVFAAAGVMLCAALIFLVKPVAAESPATRSNS